MLSVGKMSNRDPPPLPSRNPPRRPSVGNVGRPLPPPPKTNYENHELPHLKKSGTAPAGFNRGSQCQPPSLPPTRSQSVREHSGSHLSVSNGSNDRPPELPPSRGQTLRNARKFSLPETPTITQSSPALPPPRPTRRPLPALPTEECPPDEDSKSADSEDLEERFRFHSINDLTPPEEFEDITKTYASHRVRRERQRRSSSPE